MQAQTEYRNPAEVPARRRRRITVVAAAAGVAAAAVVGGLLAADRLTPPAAAGSMELSLPASGGDIFASCLPFTVEYLAEMSPAFAGTAIEVTGDRAVLQVDRWYAGGDAAEVVVTVPDGAHVALNGDVDFQEGKRYLITAEGGIVNLCGYSGEATAELESAFESAF